MKQRVTANFFNKINPPTGGDPKHEGKSRVGPGQCYKSHQGNQQRLRRLRQMCRETLRSKDPDLVAAIEGGQLVARRLELATGGATTRPARASDGLAFDGNVLTTTHGPRYRMLVIGASQLSKYLAQIALGLDYQVTVCDPRVEYEETWDVAGVPLVKTMPDDAVLEMKLDERCAVIALTHDPKLDDMALMEALKSPAFYVGALGSRANNAKRRDRLKDLDVTEAQIARLHGPIGLHIGSRTPPEIAVSILAEITAVKNGVSLPDVATIAVAKEKLAPSVACETE